VFQRAFVHQELDLARVFGEAKRILVPGAALVVEDRTIDDVTQPGDPGHIHGLFLEAFPKLEEYERSRRIAPGAMEIAVDFAGFLNARSELFWEVRCRYANIDDLATELATRAGRSVLDKLDDEELARLIEFVRARVPADREIIEHDRWTFWIGNKPV
jgi:hypothetical protein